MAANTVRYIVESHGADYDALETAFREAFREAVQICSEMCIENITLVVQRKKSLPDTVVGRFVGRLLGEDASKALFKGKSKRLANKVNLSLESLRTFDKYGQHGFLLAIHLSGDDMDKIDSADAKAILYLPWLEDEGKEWISIWNPTVLGESTWEVPLLSLEPAVEAALKALTSLVNLGMLHPNDERDIKEAFAKLKRAGHRPSSKKIRAWARQNGWPGGSASELRKLAKRSFG